MISGKTSISKWPIPQPGDNAHWFDIGNTIELIDQTMEARFIEIDVDPEIAKEALRRVQELEDRVDQVECIAVTAKNLAQDALDTANGIAADAAQAKADAAEAKELAESFGTDIADAKANASTALDKATTAETLATEHEARLDDHEERIVTLEDKSESWDKAAQDIDTFGDTLTDLTDEVVAARGGRTNLKARIDQISEDNPYAVNFEEYNAIDLFTDFKMMFNRGIMAGTGYLIAPIIELAFEFTFSNPMGSQYGGWTRIIQSVGNQGIVTDDIMFFRSPKITESGVQVDYPGARSRVEIGSSGNYYSRATYVTADYVPLMIKNDPSSGRIAIYINNTLLELFTVGNTYRFEVIKGISYLPDNADVTTISDEQTQLS